jgi:uncharacterized protein GlcG (DUF336 family)
MSIGKTILAVGILLGPAPASAQVSQSGYVLPMHLALDAALAAISSCEAHGWNITVTVVDVAGTPELVLRGDHATIHTKDSSFRKAYTIVTMGPIFKIDTTAQFVDVLEKYHNAALAQYTPQIMPLGGGVAIKAHGEIVAGLGVGGSPGAENDAICAEAGVAKIQNDLPR